MTISRQLAAAAIAAAAGATMLACAPAALAAPIDIDVRVAPPAARFEAVPAARPGYIWAPGYWDWRANRYAWVGGNWVRERPGYIYTQPTWVNHGGRYHLYRGAWAHGRGDGDGDGVPNRYDRRPGNPYRR